MRIGAGAFVCGEETALIASIEGGRGLPRPRPPYPAAVWLVGQADADQQRRDLCQRAPIVAQGGEWFAGTAPKRARAPKSSRWLARSKHRSDRSANGYHRARDVFDIGGGIPDGSASRRSRRAGRRRLHTQQFWTCRWITSRWRRSARSWARAA